MAITFDTLEYVNELKAADVPEKQAQVQARAMRSVLDTALAEQTRAAQQASERAASALDSKTERAVLKLDIRIDALDGKIAALDGKLESELALIRKEIALARRDTIIWLGGMLVAGFGLVLRYIA